MNFGLVTDLDAPRVRVAPAAQVPYGERRTAKRFFLSNEVIVDLTEFGAIEYVGGICFPEPELSSEWRLRSHCTIRSGITSLARSFTNFAIWSPLVPKPHRLHLWH